MPQQNSLQWADKIITLQQGEYAVAVLDNGDLLKTLWERYYDTFGRAAFDTNLVLYDSQRKFGVLAFAAHDDKHTLGGILLSQRAYIENMPLDKWQPGWLWFDVTEGPDGVRVEVSNTPKVAGEKKV